MSISYLKVEMPKRYYFWVYPRNGQSQPLAVSTQGYLSESQCNAAMSAFCAYVVENGLQSADEKRVKIIRLKKDGFRFVFLSDEEMPLLISYVEYTTKANCQKGIGSVFRAIQESL